MRKRLTQEEAEARCLANNYGWPDGVDFGLVHQKYPLICLTCGDNTPKVFADVGRSGCKKCANATMRSANTFTHDEAVARGLAAKHPALLLEPCKGNKFKHKYRFLDCGHKWETIPNSLWSGHGCGRCYGNHGPTYVYFMQHEGYNAYKIGITAVDQKSWHSRIRHHEYTGWTLVHKVRCETRDEAEAAEKAVLYSWRHFPDGVTPEQIKKGHGETVSRVYVKEADVISVMSDLALV